MAHQEAFTLLARISEGQTEPLKHLLGNICDNGGSCVVPFAKLPRVHFGQFVVFDATADLAGQPLPARLVLLTNVDGTIASHLDDLATICGEGLDAVFSHCENYPGPADRSPASRRTYLQDHSFKSKAVHINRRGRTVEQIRQEELLRRELNAFLDAGDFSHQSPTEIKSRLVSFVRGRADLAWALRKPEPPALSWRVKEYAHGVFYGVLAIVLLPLVLIALPVFAVLLRYHEKRDVPDRSIAPAEKVHALRNDEDYWAHNQMIAVGLLKPGLFRKIAMNLILGIADYGTRHIYNRGILSGLNTIHFARWVAFDDGRRMCFSSNYDGSLESYMNDFIDKAAWGVNAIFGNGDGFPTTAFMVCQGITDEKAYKRFLHTRLVRTNVWYSAYPHLTTQNISNNEAIRKGLLERMDDAEICAWLHRLGSGNQLPASGLVARMLDGLPWDKICRLYS